MSYIPQTALSSGSDVSTTVAAQATTTVAASTARTVPGPYAVDGTINVAGTLTVY